MAKDDRLGQILVGRYRMRRPVGAGAHGRVYLAEDLGQGGTHVAFKVVEGIVGGTRREDADHVLRWFRHPNWADVIDGGTLREDAWFQVTRFIPGDSLDKIEGAQSPAFVWRFLEDGARVLGALHRQGLIHYDVTPGNWIANRTGADPTFVLTDGGLAHVGAVQGFARGTPQYMAPEVTEDIGHDHRADLYSLGLVAFRLATGRDPIEGDAGDVLGRRRREAAPRASSLNSDVPAVLDDLLVDLLARDPNARPHDAYALLERIAKALGRDVPAIVDREAVAASEGGPLVERTEELERFGRTLDVLTRRLPTKKGRAKPRPAPVVEDAVLVLHGEPGCGTTRLAEEMVHRTRDADVPVLVMSGRETTADRRGPLRHLVDGMVTLGVAEGDPIEEIRLELRDRDGVGREERSHAVGRAGEQFIRAVESASRRTPFVLVIEDFEDLPTRAREAVLVLSRELLSRRESAGGTSALPVLLVVDVGSGDTTDLLIPDAADPEGPLMELAALEPSGIARICSDRFPGLNPEGADLDAIHRVSEGLPGVLVSLLGEACRRADLRCEIGKWLWNVDHIDDYQIQRGLSPVHADALRQADGSVLDFLRKMSLADGPIDEGAVLRLLSSVGLTAVPTTPALHTETKGGRLRYVVSRAAVREELRQQLSPKEARSAALELAELVVGGPALQRARLMLLGERFGAVVDTLHSSWSSLHADSRQAAQKVLLSALEGRPELADSRDIRSALTEMLEYGQQGAELAKRISPSIGPEEATSAERTAHVLEYARLREDALALLQRVASGARVGEASARIWTSLARLQFDLQQYAPARDALKRARQIIRALGTDCAERSRLRTEFLMVDARSRFLLGRKWRARLCLNAALIGSRRGASISHRVKVLNNLGIVCQQQGDLESAQRHFKRSLRLRRLIGDAEGVIKTTINLGRLAQMTGELLRSAGHFQQAASIAVRHGQNFALCETLRELAQVYDQQLNARLAVSTLQRAIGAGRRVGHGVGVATAAWDLAPLAAATGDSGTASDMLVASAHAARQGVADHARASHELTSALTHLHLGDLERTAVHLRRLHRHRDSLHMANRLALQAISPFSSKLAGHRVRHEAGRPPLGSDARHLYRAATWWLRASRGVSAPPAPTLYFRAERATRALSDRARPTDPDRDGARHSTNSIRRREVRATPGA